MTRIIWKSENQKLDIIKVVFRGQFKALHIDSNESYNEIILNRKYKILEKHNKRSLREIKGRDLFNQ